MRANSLRKLVRAGRNFELTWRYGFNLTPTLSYRFAPGRLSGEAARVERDLDRNGIAITSAALLFEDPMVFNELTGMVDTLERQKEEELAIKRTAANDAAIGEKTFNVELLGGRPLLDPASVFARFALQQPILQIANAYFGMYTRLRYYNIWHTFATQAEARESQLWHFDREDHYILKVFVYFSDVDDEAGPFTYAPGTHLKIGLNQSPEYFVEGGVRRSDDEQMAAVVPRERWIKATGRRGTIVFADTRGYHKGGLARMHDRIMYLCMFTSRASQSEELFSSPGKLESFPDKATFFALSNPLR